MSEVHAVLFFEHLPKIDGKLLVTDLNWRWPELGDPTNLVRGQHDVGFALGEAAVMLVTVDAPYDTSRFDQDRVSSVLWPGGDTAVLDHQSHMIVSVDLEGRRGTDLMSVATKVTSSALTAAPTSLGVYWPTTPQLVKRSTFIERAGAFPSLPLDLWVDVTVGRGRAGSTTGSTQGLRAFGLRELEMVDVPESKDAVRTRLTTLVSQILSHRRNIADGATLGYDEHYQVKVRVGPSQLGREGETSQIEYLPSSDEAIIDAAAHAAASRR